MNSLVLKVDISAKQNHLLIDIKQNVKDLRNYK